MPETEIDSAQHSPIYFRTYLDRMQYYNDASLLIYLGTPGEEAFQVTGPVVTYRDFSNGAPSPEDLDPKLLMNGVTVVVNTEDYARWPEAMAAYQKALLHHYCKFMVYPRSSLTIPDRLGVREAAPPNIFLETAKATNCPWHLRYPLVDKLKDARVGLPVLLLLPGPSVQALGPHLQALSRKCLVACLSRSLNFCVENGVVPDFVVQLDTNVLQRHFYPPDADLSRSCLVPLSVSSFSTYAERFRGIFFMDSFHMGFLPNPARLRESWLSSLTSCLGLGEALHAPRILLAGADLAFDSRGGGYHHNATLPDQREPYPHLRPLTLSDRTFYAPDCQGRKTLTNMAYFATAHEAMLLGREITKATGAQYVNVSGEGILDPEMFPPMAPLDAVADLPDLDRAAYLETIDAALAHREKIDLLRYKVDLLKTSQQLRENLLFMEFQLHEDKAEELERHPFVQAVEKIAVAGRYFAAPGEDEWGELALNLTKAWRGAVCTARAWVEMAMLWNKGRTVPLVCLDEEREDAAAHAAARFPGLQVAAFAVWANTTDPPGTPPVDERVLIYEEKPLPPAPEETGWIPFFHLFKWASSQKCVLVSRAARGRFGRELDLLGLDNLLDL